jgi:adenine-specific DNA glycosylase
MICRARAPRCSACPLRRSCDFRATNRARVTATPALMETRLGRARPRRRTRALSERSGRVVSPRSR